MRQREVGELDDRSSLQGRLVGADAHARPVRRLHGVRPRVAVLHQRGQELVDQVRVRAAVAAALQERQVLRVVDLGRWWQKVTGLPLPLGGNAIRRSLGREMMSSVTQALHDSIQYAIEHREEALAYAMQFARDLDTQLADKFVGMYVNERTLDYGSDGREAVRRLLDMGHKAGIIPQVPRVEWV